MCLGTSSRHLHVLNVHFAPTGWGAKLTQLREEERPDKMVLDLHFGDSENANGPSF
jgi:hypothetical protein